jgi:hypothetical protein
MTVQEELAKIPEFNDHFVYHWRNLKDHTMDVDYFIGYKFGTESGVYKHHTKRMLQDLTDDDILAMVEGYKSFLSSVKSEIGEVSDGQP